MWAQQPGLWMIGLCYTSFASRVLIMALTNFSCFAAEAKEEDQVGVMSFLSSDQFCALQLYCQSVVFTVFSPAST